MGNFRESSFKQYASLRCRANLVGCLICQNASIAAGSEFRDCLVGSGQTVSGKNLANKQKNQNLAQSLYI